MKLFRSRWRLALLAAASAVALVVTFNLAALIVTSAKVLKHGAVFDRWRGPVSRSTVWIGEMPADIYASARSRTQLLFVHGVNESGKDSADLRPAAEAFAGSGFRVIAPDFVRLKRQNVTPADVDDIVFLIQKLNADTGIVCASYGCGPALIAATRPEVRDRVLFVAVFGGYFDLHDTLQAIITGPPSPLAYSKWFYMGANIDLVESRQSREQLLAIATERRTQPPEKWRLSSDGLDADASAMLALYESKTAEEFDQRLAVRPRFKERIEQLSPSRYMDGLRAPLIVVHLGSDPSIPSVESRRLASAAAAHGVPCHLTILELHGHTRPDWPDPAGLNLLRFYLPEGWKFIRALNEVLSYA